MRAVQRTGGVGYAYERLGGVEDGSSWRRTSNSGKRWTMEVLQIGSFGWRMYVRRQPEANIYVLVHRLNLFPVMHLNFFHMIFNLIAVTPLIERFESEYGTLVTLALFTGRKRIPNRFW
jgi:membrane associated rhomboid family serine protease